MYIYKYGFTCIMTENDDFFISIYIKISYTINFGKDIVIP
jgi:hypothetical protein